MKGCFGLFSKRVKSRRKNTYCNEGKSQPMRFLHFSLFGESAMREAAYQAKVVKRLRDMFPGCFIQKNDPAQQQGVPDILILFRDRWAMLEFKHKSNSSRQVNQEYFVDQFNEMSFAAFIEPENEEEVLYALGQALVSRSRVS